MKLPQLDRLAALLRRRPMTAREIAGALGVCTPTAYARVRALQARGDLVFELKRPPTKPGPPARAFGIRQDG